MDNEKKEVVYLCNGLDPECSEKIGCYRCLDPNMRMCCHTKNEAYAMYSTCNDPENHPDRFDEYSDENGTVKYWEIEPGRNFWETGIM